MRATSHPAMRAIAQSRDISCFSPPPMKFCGLSSYNLVSSALTVNHWIFARAPCVATECSEYLGSIRSKCFHSCFEFVIRACLRPCESCPQVDTSQVPSWPILDHLITRRDGQTPML